MAKNASSNLNAGSKMCPIVSECRDVGAGIAAGDFQKVSNNAGLIGLYAAPFGGAGAGAQKTAVLGSQMSMTASSAAQGLALGSAHQAVQKGSQSSSQNLEMSAGGASGAGGSKLHPVAGRFKDELIRTAQDIGAPGKGILAADESTGTIGKRLAGINVENTHDNRKAYRELLFTAPGIENHISGVITYDETTRDSTADGRRFVKVLRDRGIHVGIKVDAGLDPLAGGAEGETFTKGLDGLAARCAEYYEMGCRFAKWRAVLKIGDGMPTDAAIRENAQGLAAYGAICQAHGLVPIIEPEILQDGEHSIEVCAEVSERVFAAVAKAMQEYGLLTEGLMLKPNMVTPGAACPKRATPEEIAWMTVRTLSRTMVPALPVVCFLSGGQSEENASLNLNAMNKLDAKRPWALTFSYGRALQSSVLKAWQGKPENVAAAQAALLTRCQANGSAALGKYAGGTGSTQSDFVADYKY